MEEGELSHVGRGRRRVEEISCCVDVLRGKGVPIYLYGVGEVKPPLEAPPLGRAFP